MQGSVDMRMKLTNAHEDMWIYYIIKAVNLQHIHVSATLFGLPQVGIIQHIYFKYMKTHCTGAKQ